MPQLLGVAKSFVDRLLGSKNQEVNVEAVTSLRKPMAYPTLQNTETKTIGSETLQYSKALQNETINAQRTGEGRKRARAEEGEQSEQKRTRQGRSEADKRFFGDYTESAGAHPLSVPESREEVETKRLNAAMSHGKLGGGTHRIVNTLNQQPLAGQRKHSSVNGTIHKKEQPGLHFSRSRGMNVPPSRPLRADGFGSDLIQLPKRQKMNDGSPSLQQQVDLTNDDSQQELHFGAVLGRPKTNGTMFSGSLPMEHSIASQLDQYTRVVPGKKKRKPRESPGSSQPSNRATPNHSHNFSPEVEQTANQSYPEVPGSDDQDVQFVSASTRKRPSASKDAAEARNGVHTRQHQKQDPVADEDAEDAVKVLRNAMRPSVELNNLESQWHERARPRMRRTIPQDTTLDTVVDQPKNVVMEQPDLRKKFSRDQPELELRPKQVQQAGQRASQRMQATSNSRAYRVSSSEDELTGRPTVPSVASRSASPQKTQARLLDQHKERDKSAPQRSHSPSALEPTAFYSSGRQNTKTQSQSRKQQADQSDEETRIPVKMIFCRSCCIEQPGIELVWANDGFLVECNGEAMKVPNRGQLVFIGRNESNQWIQAEKNASLFVQIKGSKTSNSNGSIIVEFEDRKGLSNCHEGLLAASRQTMKTVVYISKEKMDKIVNQQCNDIVSDHQKNSRSQNLVDPDLVGMQKRRDKRQVVQPSDEEQILYEDDDFGSRQTRRSLMQAQASQDETPLGRRSKYFAHTQATDNLSSPLLRQSARATRAAKPKPATPPPPVRWTRENKFERWSHSVLYPEEGAVRRVIVDFNDLERLDEGEFLNDNIIGFALRRIEETMAPEHKDSVLFFNSYFYTSLTTKSGKKAFNYDAVKRWTKNKDVFSYPYIVVPINIDLHWFVMIICNLPNLSRRPPDLEEDPDNEGEMLLDGHQGETGGLDDIDTGVADGDLATRDTQKSMRHLSLSDEEKDSKPSVDNKRDADYAKSAQEPSSSRPSTASGRKSKKKGPARQRTFDPDGPSIITLDSFGVYHPAETRTLKDYLNAEAEEKRGMQVTSADIQGMNAKGIPTQNNFCDCGVYVVGYIEEFAKDPRRFVNKVLRKEFDESSDFATFDPSAKRAEIRDELLKLQKEQDAERKSKKSAKKGVGTVNGNISKANGTLRTTGAQTTKNIESKPANDGTAFMPCVPTPANVPDSDMTIQNQISDAIGSSPPGIPENDDLEQAVPRPFFGHLPAFSSDGARVSLSPELAGDGVDGTADREDVDFDLEQARSKAIEAGLERGLLSQLEDAMKAGQYTTEAQTVGCGNAGEERGMEIQDSQESRHPQRHAV